MSILTMHHGLMAGAVKKAPPVDPHIILLWDGVSNYGPQPTSGVTPTIHYDTNGPLDVSGTGWTGTPYVNSVELGGYAPNATQLVRGDNYGIHFNQSDILNKINAGNFSIECWIRRKTSGGDNTAAVGVFNANQNWCYAIGTHYGNIVTHLFYGSSSTWTTLITNSDNNWHHIAISYDGRKAYLFADGVLITSSSSYNPHLPIDIFTICSGYLGNYRGENDIAQVVVWDMAKYTASFTPPTRPYILGA